VSVVIASFMPFMTHSRFMTAMPHFSRAFVHFMAFMLLDDIIG